MLTSGEHNLTNLEKGENEVFEINDAKFTLTTTTNQKNNNELNETSIDLGHCEDLLKKHYNIPDNDKIFMKKIDVRIEGMKIPATEYEVYAKLGRDNLIKLNLTVCQEIKIDIRVPVKLRWYWKIKFK